jgi:hypothetical protein
MTLPQLLTWVECHPLPWRPDREHGLVDAEGYPIGTGGTWAQREAFCAWLAALPGVLQAITNATDAEPSGTLPWTINNVLYDLELTVDGEADDDDHE